MTRARAGALLAVLAIAIAVVLAVIRFRQPEPLPPRPPGERATLLLLTSLPLLFGEDFSLGGGGSPALSALQTRYRVAPISVSSAEELAKGRLLLMAQPMAQPPEDLVALDDWVRRGGRMMLLADPMLDWPSARPLGDPLRPLPMFMDTGLLSHWGVSLDPPREQGIVIRALGGERIATSSPGTLRGSCKISKDRLVADCRIGMGEAIVVADSDFLDAADIGEGAEHNVDGLLRALDALEHK
jgi:hypothetical protein